MKKIILLSVFLVSISTIILAQDDLPDAGMLPDNPLYFFKNWGEVMRVWFTFDHEERIRLKLHYAEVRLAEYNGLVLKNKTDLAERIKEKYQEGLEDVESDINESVKEGKNITDLVEHISNRTYRHIAVLERVLEQVPEQARPAIEKVINISIMKHEIAVERIQARINAKEMLVGKVNCTDDSDCGGLGCPLVLGNDTAVCKNHRCMCEAQWNINRDEWRERYREEFSEQKEIFQEKIRERIESRNKTKGSGTTTTTIPVNETTTTTQPTNETTTTTIEVNEITTTTIETNETTTTTHGNNTS